MAANFCPKCGTSVDGMNFCPKCGHQVGAALPPAPQVLNAEPSFIYPENERHSDIITANTKNGEPVVEFRRLHPNAIWLFVLQYLKTTGILLILFAITIFVEPILTAVLVTCYFVALYSIALLSYNHYRFEVSTSAFRKEHGIFHKYTVSIAFDQIQNINMRRTIIDQMMGLAHLEIETAGTGGFKKMGVASLFTYAEGYIPGITVEEAHDIKALMLARIQE